MWDWKLNICAILAICLIHNGNALSRIDPLVDSKVGLIRGLRASDGDYSMFMGIPYATVNESNPFGPSIPHPGFEDTFEAYDDSAICPQLEEFGNTIVGTLDCLHLNVYVPNTANSRNQLPVLVWIYGGGFTIGYSGRHVYGPKYLVQHNVVLVTLNYRLGPYGFMCLDTPDIPGNQGLKDQQTALRWVKNNIEAFGGDPNKITIFGESAGGASVDYQLTYGKEKLFDQVILQSGVGLCPWALKVPDESAVIKIAGHLGLPTTDVSEAVEFLAQSDVELVIAATTELDIRFKPCVEKEFEGVERFIYDYPANIKNVNVRNVPILMGYNSDERLAWYEHLTPEEYAKLNPFFEALEESFIFESEEYLKEMEAELRHFYIGDEKFSEDVKEGLVRFSSDHSFNYPVMRTLNKYLDSGAKNIYYYLFFYDGDRNFVKERLNITSPGAIHADEISYFFDVSFMDQTPTPEDQLIIDRVTTLWTNFAKYGNPTPEVTELLPVQWPVVTKDQLNYLYIDTELKVQKRNFKSRIALWNLFYKINQKYEIGYRDDDE
ncbi:juvenile hormone esterase-like [Anticarsia gemmatalis]|uniref:juvenile hormone esterase-like n=1 Tax=Anticarsia gemmatalis TaxID=129554 RepID=UPI003F76C159